MCWGGGQYSKPGVIDNIADLDSALLELHPSIASPCAGVGGIKPNRTVYRNYFPSFRGR